MGFSQKKMQVAVALALSCTLLFGCTPRVSTTPLPPTTTVAAVDSSLQSENCATEPLLQGQDSGKVDSDGGAFSQKDLIYFVLPDRYKKGAGTVSLPDVDPSDPKAYNGGNLKGVTESLDYIKSLGTTAIWLTPVMTNAPDGYHGYWIHDFYTVDPHLGTLDDLKTLVSEAHKRDMKVILDYVVNHTGYDTPWFKDPQKKHWFHPKKNITDWNNQQQIENGWIFGLPDLDTENPEVVQFFIDNALWWIGETGIDGFRLDTVKHVPKVFWQDFSGAIKARYPEFFLLGEVWSEHTSVVEPYREVGIDSLTNYPLFVPLTEALSRSGNVKALAKAVEKDQALSRPDISGLFLDNHDNARLVSTDPTFGLDYLHLGLTFLYTYPSIPLLYYGTEIGMAGGKDPDNRRMMDWLQTDPASNNQTLAYVKELVKIRQKYVGTINWLANDDKFMAYTVQSKDGGPKLLVVLNTDTKARKVSFEVDGTGFTPVAGSSIKAKVGAALVHEGNTANLDMPAFGIALFEVKP